MTYCWSCELCGGRTETPGREVPECRHESTSFDSLRSLRMRRDYRAEHVGVEVVGLRREREAGGPSAMRDTFLPTARDYMSPSDPDGQKGIRGWAEKHQPKDENKHPKWPDIARRSF